MATRSPQAASPNSELDEDDLWALCEALYPVNKKYKFFGLHIGVKKSEIDTIEAQQTDPGERLLEILSVRVKKTKPLTWNDIYSALRSDSVGEGKVANSIRKKYGHLFSPDPSIGGMSDQEPIEQLYVKEKSERKTKRRKVKVREVDSHYINVGGRVTKQSKKYSDRPVSDQENVAMSSEDNKEYQRGKKVRKFLRTDGEKRIAKPKLKKEKFTEEKAQSESEVYYEKAKVKRKKTKKHGKEKSVTPEFSEMESDDQDDQAAKLPKTESENEFSADDNNSENEMSSQLQSGRSEMIQKRSKSKASTKHAHTKSEAAVHKEVKLQKQHRSKKIKQRMKYHYESVDNEEEQYSDEVVKKKPPCKKKKRSKVMELEDESSSNSSSEDESEVEFSRELTQPKSKVKLQSDKNKKGNKTERGKESGKFPKAKSGKQKDYASRVMQPLSRDKDKREKAKDAAGMENVTSRRYAKGTSSDQVRSSKATKKMREKPVASRMQTTISSEKDTSGSEDESVDEESDSDNSCENEDGDVQEYYSSSEENEKSIDGGSSATTSDVDVNIQPKEGSKKGYKESSTHTQPLPGISSSPSTAKQEHKPQPKERRHRKCENRKKGRNKSEASSETGDSSPECDMLKNISEAEKEKLLGIYRRFFGKLCCAVLNPVEIAAQLQEKCLISQAMMKGLIMSPESQQAKTISVVDALEKKIKLDSDHLFVFIEVLLGDDSPELQKTGSEILREAGKLLLMCA